MCQNMNSIEDPQDEMRCAGGSSRATPVRTFPFLLLPFFPLLIDRGGAVAGAGLGGCSRGVAPVGTLWLVASPPLSELKFLAE